ncbi:MAG: GNAT family N-acetyltransferase [Candidatus Shapirobacteria bacterium]
MNEYKLVFQDGDLKEEDRKILVDGMLAYHASKGHPRKKDVFSIVLRDQSDKLLGCVLASVLWNGMEIDSLWVDESIRKQGWGRKLMAAVEAEGTKRGCTFSYTNTFTWQAPEFYEKLGYKLYGKLEDFPKGCCLSYYRKSL